MAVKNPAGAIPGLIYAGDGVIDLVEIGQNQEPLELGEDNLSDFTEEEGESQGENKSNSDEEEEGMVFTEDEVESEDENNSDSDTDTDSDTDSDSDSDSESDSDSDEEEEGYVFTEDEAESEDGDEEAQADDEDTTPKNPDVDGGTLSREEFADLMTRNNSGQAGGVNPLIIPTEESGLSRAAFEELLGDLDITNVDPWIIPDEQDEAAIHFNREEHEAAELDALTQPGVDTGGDTGNTGEGGVPDSSPDDGTRHQGSGHSDVLR